MKPTGSTTVEEILQSRPKSGRVFIENQTDCSGCRLARFCTLAEVAEVYALDLEAFLLALATIPKRKRSQPI